MERSKLADLSEILSSIAIVITLVYLTVEIRQNTSALEGQTRQAVLNSAQAEIALFIGNPDLAVALASTGPLASVDQHIQMDGLLSTQLRSREFSWLQYRDGAIDDAQWDTELAILRTIFDSSLARLWWERMGRGYAGPEFVAFVDSLFQATPATDRVWPAVLNWSTPEPERR